MCALAVIGDKKLVLGVNQEFHQWLRLRGGGGRHRNNLVALPCHLLDGGLPRCSHICRLGLGWQHDGVISVSVIVVVCVGVVSVGGDLFAFGGYLFWGQSETARGGWGLAIGKTHTK